MSEDLIAGGPPEDGGRRERRPDGRPLWRVPRLESAWQRNRGPLGVVATVVLLAAAVLSLVLTHPGRPGRRSATTGVSASPSPSAPDLSSPVLPTEPAAASRAFDRLVGVAEPCPPVTDGVSTLTVSFMVRNATTLPFSILEAEPSLPLGGLRVLATTISHGTCQRTAEALGSDPVTPGATARVVFVLGLPSTCAKPLPVQAFLRVRQGTLVLAGTMAVLPDLGGLDLAACRAEEAASPNG